MGANCKRCGDVVIPNGSGFKCRCCGAVYASEEELKPKPRQTTAAAPSYQTQSAGTPNFAYPPHTSTIPQSTGSAVSSEMEPEDIYANTGSGVVEIVTEAGCASGFILSKKGFVLTNAHAVINAEGKPCGNIFVKHGGVRIPARLIAIGDTDNNNEQNVDLALLAMERFPQNAIALRLGESAKVKIGQRVYYIGNSKGEGLCMTAGIVSDNNRGLGKRRFIMTDAATNPGNSGGPLFNTAGEVIGVHVSARNEAVGMKYAIPIDTARLFLNTVEDQLGIARNTLAEYAAPHGGESMESVSAGVILTLVLSGITLLVKNIEFVKEIIDTVG